MEVETIGILRACLEYAFLAFACRVAEVPQFDGVALVDVGIDMPDIHAHTGGILHVLQTEGEVRIVDQPIPVHLEVMGVTRIGSHVAMAFVHRPIVHQTIDITVLGLVLRGSDIVQIAAVAVEGEVVHCTLHVAEIEVVVIVVADGS